MFIILLRFSENKDQVKTFVDGHVDWLEQGFAQGIFLVAGRILPSEGGSILAHNISKEALDVFVNKDPFVENLIVTAEIIETSPAMADERLNFLIGKIK